MVALEKGAEVFKNSCTQGDIDIVLRIDNEFIPIDVKQKAWRPIPLPGYFGAIHGNTIPDGVWGVAVDPETKKVSWYRPPGRPKAGQDVWLCPAGWEDFWND